MITAILRRKRLILWLLRAYIKKRKRTILAFFVAGVLGGLLLYFALPRFIPLFFVKTQVIGVIGSYKIENLPIEIQNHISLGLTRITETGEASPSAATSFEVEDNGKTYTFFLRPDLIWQDGKAFIASDVNYNFKDVTIEVRNEQELAFHLKEPYAPFPIVLSQPLFRKGLIGLSGRGNVGLLGTYKVLDIKRNGDFIERLTIAGNMRETRNTRIRYRFYPNEEVAKLAFMLGEVDMLIPLLDPGEFAAWKRVHMAKLERKDLLVTLFYNTSFPLLSDKTVRQALTYALPRDLKDGERASSPLSTTSWAYVEQHKYAVKNIETARKLLQNSEVATKSASLALTLTTTARFRQLAENIKNAWREIGVDTTIEVVQTIPSDPQVLLERFQIPNDPDQYILWHSTQATNISRFANPKIDKLLEDGRQIINQEERAQIYADFQRHIVEESPAAFLYYPTVYTISRK